MTTALIAFLLLFCAIVLMAVGIWFKKRGGELKGSCGGPEQNPDCCMNKQEKNCQESLHGHCETKDNSCTKP